MPIFGAVRNPYDAEHVPGGSSGGSGAAVAAWIAPLAIAEDTAGSIRCPAAWCGISGLRPTYGRYPDAGIMPLSENKFDQVGSWSTSTDVEASRRGVTGSCRVSQERQSRQ